MQFEPLYDKIIAKEIKQPVLPAGNRRRNIHPGNCKRKPFLAEVIAAGDGMLTKDGKVIQLKVKPGDK